MALEPSKSHQKATEGLKLTSKVSDTQLTRGKRRARHTGLLTPALALFLGNLQAFFLDPMFQSRRACMVNGLKAGNGEKGGTPLENRPQLERCDHGKKWP